MESTTKYNPRFTADDCFNTGPKQLLTFLTEEQKQEALRRLEEVKAQGRKQVKE